jgi:hypothetical protein
MPPTSSKSFFGIKVSKFGVPVNQATDQNLIYKDNFSTKTYFDNTTARIIEGLLPDGTYGMLVSKVGFDVRTATGTNLVFNSNQDIFKIVSKVSMNLSIVTTGTGTAVGSTSTPHNLSYTPAYMAFITIDSALAALSSTGTTNGPNPFIISPATSGGAKINALFSVTVDATNINFGGQLSVGGSATYSNSATVYLLQETFS